MLAVGRRVEQRSIDHVGSHGMPQSHPVNPHNSARRLSKTVGAFVVVSPCRAQGSGPPGPATNLPRHPADLTSA